jgi:hypothetical protein
VGVLALLRLIKGGNTAKEYSEENLKNPELVGARKNRVHLGTEDLESCPKVTTPRR